MKRFCILTLAAIAAVSCSKEQPEYQAIELNASLEQPSTKIALDGLDSPFASQRAWNWQQGDKLSGVYHMNGKDTKFESSEAVISQEEPGKAGFTIKIPKGADLKTLEYGSAAAFGKVLDGASSTIPSSMVYARNDINQSGNVFINVVMNHCCSYLYLDPDNINSQSIASYTITGTGLKGGEGSETITVPFTDYLSGGAWLSVSNNATDVSINITLNNGSTVSQTISSTGNGVCRLIHVKYKKFIDYE